MWLQRMTLKLQRVLMKYSLKYLNDFKSRGEEQSGSGKDDSDDESKAETKPQTM